MSMLYVPVLKWHQGEYQALLRLKNSVKGNITPLLNIPPIGWDFKEERMKETAHDHVEKFPKRYLDKWGNRESFIDFHESLHDALMNDGSSVVSHVFDHLHIQEQKPVPVTGISRSDNYEARIKAARRKINNGLALRVKLDELMHPDVSKHIADLTKRYGVIYSGVDLIVDLGAPENFEPYEGFAKALAKRIETIAGIETFRSFIIVGTSINLSTVKPPGTLLPRHEWSLYKALMNELKGIRSPTYGDYTIETPAYSSLDMRLMKPAGKIVYATEDSWFVPKGKAFRGNERQMIQHCKRIIESEFYKGSNYSLGDKIIENTANEVSGCSNLSTWKQVGFSHHITFVSEQLANFHGA